MSTLDLAPILADLDRLIGREHDAARITDPAGDALAAFRVKQAFRAMYPALAALREHGVNPQSADSATTLVPTWLLAAVHADLLCQRDRARGEPALAAALGTTEAQAGDAFEEMWRAVNPGIAAFLDQTPDGFPIPTVAVFEAQQ